MVQVTSSDAFWFNLDTSTRSRVSSTICALACKTQYLPLSCWINPETIALPNEPHIFGICSQVYCGTRYQVHTRTRYHAHRRTEYGGFVAVKVLRTSNQDLTKLMEVSRWDLQEESHADMVRLDEK